MKKFTISSIIVLLTFLGARSVHAQQKGTNELRAGYGAFTSVQFLDLANDLTIIGITAGNLSYENKNFSNTFYGGYKYAVNDNIMLGATFAFEKVTDDVVSRRRKVGERDSKTYTLAIEADYYYMSDTFVRLYSGLGAGYSFNRQKFTSTDPTLRNQDDKFDHFNFHVNALGIRLGNALGVFAEIGFGYKGIANLGISYQF